MAIIILLLDTSSCKINHFGIKPVKGGSPPRDRSVRRMAVVIGADLFHRFVSDLIFVTDTKLSMRNRVSVAMM